MEGRDPSARNFYRPAVSEPAISVCPSLDYVRQVSSPIMASHRSSVRFPAAFSVTRSMHFRSVSIPPILRLELVILVSTMLPGISSDGLMSSFVSRPAYPGLLGLVSRHPTLLCCRLRPLPCLRLSVVPPDPFLLTIRTIMTSLILPQVSSSCSFPCGSLGGSVHVIALITLSVS